MLHEVLSGRRLTRLEYEHELPKLQDGLLDAQFELRKSRARGGGADRHRHPGRRPQRGRERVARLARSQVRRGVRLPEPNEVERERPTLWRYWRVMPPKGRIAILHAGWYEEFLRESVLDTGIVRRPSVRREVERIRSLERMLVADGVAVVKVHLHVGPALQRRRLRKLRADKLTRWRVTPEDLWLAGHYRRVERVVGALPRGDRAAGRAVAPGRWHGPAAPRARSGAGAARGHRGPHRARAGPARPDRRRRRRGEVRGVPCRRPRTAARAWRRRTTTANSRRCRAVWHCCRDAALREALRGDRVRGHGRRGQGRGHPPHHRGARRAAVSRGADLRAVARGDRASLPLAFLVPAAAARQLHDLRPLVVRARARRAGPGVRGTARLAARVRRNQRVRAAAHGAPRRRREVLDVGEPARSSSRDSRSATAIRSSASRWIPRTGPIAGTGRPTSAPPAT